MQPVAPVLLTSDGDPEAGKYGSIPIMTTGDSRSSSLLGWLQMNDIPDFVIHALSKAGASSVADLEYLRDDDIDQLGLAIVVRNKLKAAVRRLRDNASAAAV